MTDYELVPEDDELLAEAAGKANLHDRRELRKCLLEYLYDNHYDILVEAYKTVRVPDEFTSEEFSRDNADKGDES